MEIAFATRTIRKLCESEKKASAILGDAVATKLKNRLADLAAATCVDELVVGNPRKLSGEWNGRFMLDLPKNHSIVMVVNHEPIPITVEGDIDWRRVFRLKILHIGANHE